MLLLLLVESSHGGAACRFLRSSLYVSQLLSAPAAKLNSWSAAWPSEVCWRTSAHGEACRRNTVVRCVLCGPHEVRSLAD